MKENNVELQDRNQNGKHCNEASFISKLKKFGARLVHTAVKDILTLWYVMKAPSTLLTDKAIIVAAFGYLLLLSANLIPDMLPGLGFPEVLKTIGIAFNVVRSNITLEIEQQVAAKMPSWL